MENGVAAVIKKIIYATVATSDAEGQPWNSPVYVVYDERLNFYWASGKESQHSVNIRSNPKAFLVLYDSTVAWGTGKGVFVQAEAAEVTDPEEIAKACALRRARWAQAKQPPEDFMGSDRPRRIYRATPKKLWVNQDGKVNGFFVDERLELDVKAISRLCVPGR